MILDSVSEQTINEFLQQLGFNNFNWQGEPLTLSFEHRGNLHIEVTERGLLLARLREVNEYEAEDLIPKALRSVHSDQQLPLSVQTGMRGDRHIAFLTTLSPEQLTISGITEALAVLDFLHQQLTQ